MFINGQDRHDAGRRPCDLTGPLNLHQSSWERIAERPVRANCSQLTFLEKGGWASLQRDRPLSRHCGRRQQDTDEQLVDLDACCVRGERFNLFAHLGGAPDLAVFDRVLDRIQ